MIVGNGMIAKRFREFDDPKFCLFASGVSNSCENNIEEFHKEADMLRYYIKAFTHRRFVYLSSSLVDTGLKLPYYEHKKYMEKIIEYESNNYLIIRLSQVLGKKGNPNTLINSLSTKIKNDNPISVQKDTYRGIIDVDDFFIMFPFLIQHHNKIITFSYVERVQVIDVACILYNYYKKQPNIIFSKKGHSVPRENSDCIPYILRNLCINPEDYTEKVINKYL